MKTVYVLNLTSKRIAILMGFMLILFGVSFYFGGYFQADKKSIELISFLKNKNYDQPKEEIETFTIEDESFAEPNANDSDFYLKPADIEIQKIDLEPENLEILKPPQNSEITPRTKIISPVVEKRPEPVVKKTGFSEYFSLQLGAFSKESEAKIYQKELKLKGIASRIDKGNNYYFIRTGKAPEKDELQYLYKKIKDQLKIDVLYIKRKVSG